MKEDDSIETIIKSQSSVFDEKPDDRLWGKLEEKLDHRKNVKKLKFYRVFAFAAMITAIFAVVTVFNQYLDEHNPSLFVSNEGFTAYSLEELKNDDSFFNMDGITQLSSLYNYSIKEGPSIGGQYANSGGNLAFEIAFNNFAYVLDLDFPGMSRLYLEEQKGDTYYFRNTEGKELILNKLQDGFRSGRSSIMPEYAGKEFHLRRS